MARFYFVGCVSDVGVVHFPVAVLGVDGELGFAVAAEFDRRGLSSAAEFCEDTKAAVESGASLETVGLYWAEELSADEFADLAERGLVCSECGLDIHGSRSWVQGEGETASAYHPACADEMERRQLVAVEAIQDARFVDPLGDWSTD